MIQSVKYIKQPVNGVEQNISVDVTYTNGKIWHVPLNATDNVHWQEVQEWVKAGNSITAAD